VLTLLSLVLLDCATGYVIGSQCLS